MVLRSSNYGTPSMQLRLSLACGSELLTLGANCHQRSSKVSFGSLHIIIAIGMALKTARLLQALPPCGGPGADWRFHDWHPRRQPNAQRQFDPPQADPRTSRCVCCPRNHQHKRPGEGPSLALFPPALARPVIGRTPWKMPYVII